MALTGVKAPRPYFGDSQAKGVVAITTTNKGTSFQSSNKGNIAAWKIIARIQRLCHYTNEKAAKFLGISLTTFKKKRNEQTLSRISYDRVLRYMEILEAGDGTFDSEDEFEEWLTSPIQALGNAIPAELAMHEPGTRMVITVIMQNRYTIYS